jgi:aminoglycoside 3-N-acetyltransferase
MARECEAFNPVLEQFGVPPDGILVVHSAIATLSRQGFTAEGIIETFLEHCRFGGVFMPTMTWRTVNPAHPFWDEVNTPSHTGILTEIFRTSYATARSIHPTHSVAGWGRGVSTLLARHHIDSTPVSGNSPYGLMRDYPTYVLMIGVGLECCTAIHLPEETVNEELYVLPADTVETYTCRERSGIEHQVRTRRHRRLDRHFPRFTPSLIAKDLMRVGQIDGCSYSICSLAALLREVFAALIENPRATLK